MMNMRCVCVWGGGGEHQHKAHICARDHMTRSKILAGLGRVGPARTPSQTQPGLCCVVLCVSGCVWAGATVIPSLCSVCVCVCVCMCVCVCVCDCVCKM